MSEWHIERVGIRRSAGCLVVARRSGRILLLLRSLSSPCPGRWGPSGGKCEYGEPAEVAARRELFEETGLNYKDDLIHIHHSAHRGHEFETYLAIVDEEFMPELTSEAEGFSWVVLDDLPSPLHEGFYDLLSSKVSAGLLFKSVENVSGRPSPAWPTDIEVV